MTITPTALNLHQASQVLEVCFADQSFQLPAEYLRQFSPSAEVRGHGQAPIQFLAGKKTVKMVHVSAVGQYAVKISFDDGHNTGIYTWDLLYELGQNQPENWQRYCAQLQERGLSREPPTELFKSV